MEIAIDSLQAWLLIPKGIEAILCLFSAYKIRKISKYLVNQLFSLAFLFWAIYISLDVIVYTFGAANPSMFHLAQILFAVEMSTGIAFSYVIVSATRVIKDGEEMLRKYRGKYIEMLGLIIIMVILGKTMSLKVIETENGDLIDPATLPPLIDFRIVEIVSISSAIATIIPFLIFFLAIAYLIKVIRRTKDLEVKRKMFILTIGVSFTPLGLLYFLLRAFLFPIYTFETAIIGHIFWILSPIFVLYTQSSKKFG